MLHEQPTGRRAGIAEPCGIRGEPCTPVTSSMIYSIITVNDQPFKTLLYYLQMGRRTIIHFDSHIYCGDSG